MKENDEIIDKKIKQYLSQDKIISDRANQIFDNTLNEINSSKTTVKEKYNYRKLLAFAASLIIIFAGINVYAYAKGYENIFFMIRDVINPEEPRDKTDFFSDRDITISYKSFYITDYIEMQINKLQINKNEAKLYLYVKENKANYFTPFKYKVFNEDDSLCFYGKSKKNSQEQEYQDILNLKNYNEKQNIVKLQIFDRNDVLLKTVIINLKDKLIEAKTENVEIQKISQIKLNNFLREQLLSDKLKEENKQILILQLIDITYTDSIYITKFLYNEISEEDIQNNIIEKLPIKEGEVKFYIENNEYVLISLI